MRRDLEALTPVQALRFALEAQAWVLDVDGCLVRTARAGGAGGVPIDGAIELLQWLRGRGREFIVCTNASQRPASEYAAHLRALGLDIADAQMMTAATAAAAHLAAAHPGAAVLAVGDNGLTDALQLEGLEVTGTARPGVKAVVVGAADSYSAQRLNQACLAIADHAARLYVTVDTPWFHGGLQRSVSTSTAIAHAISGITGAAPTVCGKPSIAIGEVLRARLGGPGRDIVVVGDMASIEVQLARQMQALGVLVLSGGTAAADLAQLPPLHRPHLVADDVGHLLRQMEETQREGD